MNCSPMDPTLRVLTGGAGDPTSQGVTMGKIKATALFVKYLTAMVSDVRVLL